MVPSHVVGLDAGRELTETTRDSVLTERESERDSEHQKRKAKEKQKNVGPAPNPIVSQLFTQ